MIKYNCLLIETIISKILYQLKNFKLNINF